MALQGLDRARVDSHVSYSPDAGETYLPRTLDIGLTSAEYDPFILEQEGRLRFILLSTGIPLQVEITRWWFFTLRQKSIFMLWSLLL